jgi:DHA2 family multidrug resistance protein
MGSSVGTSMVTTLLARRGQYHQSVLSAHISQFDAAFRNRAAGLSQQLFHSGTAAPDAQTQSYGVIYQSVLAQSQTLAYIDTYMILAIGAGLMFLLAFIVRRNDPHGGGAVVVE